MVPSLLLEFQLKKFDYNNEFITLLKIVLPITIDHLYEISKKIPTILREEFTSFIEAYYRLSVKQPIQRIWNTKKIFG